MHDPNTYMADFLKVYQTLERWSPGSESDTLKALSKVPEEPRTILEIGCGNGLTTLALAENTQAKMIGLDSEQSALDRLEKRFKQQGLSERLDTVCASMMDLPFPKASVDLIWAEGSAYIMGVENALHAWKPLLCTPGYLMMSDMVWRTQTPSKEPLEFWQQEYPDIQQVQTRIEQMEQAGYRVVDHFPQSEEAWLNYYLPLNDRVKELEAEMSSSAALEDIKREVNLCSKFASEFGYHMFVLERN